MFVGIVAAAVLLLGLPWSAHSAFTSSITPDGTLGTTVTQTGKVYDINGGTIKGTNQFHSFGQFSVGTGDTASFNGPNGILNILSRITGGLQSQIDGTLRSTIPGANLYLMNPAGVLFGPNASLNLSGSFHVTTADYLRLADNVRFSAVAGVQDAVLSTAPVAAFGFLGPNAPASVSLQGSQLTLLPAQTISFIGGDIQLSGSQVSAAAGLIQIASVASAGEVVLGIPGITLNPLDISSFNRLGRTEIQSSAIDASGTPQAPIGGAILIRSGQLVMENAAILSNTAALDGAPISIISPSIQMDGGLIQTVAAGPGAGGDILVTAGTVTLSGGALLSTQSIPNPLLPGEGRAGNILISAADSISISGQRSGQFQFLPGLATYLNMLGGLYSDTYTTANSGAIRIETPRLSVQSGVVGTHTFGGGSSGDITLNLGSLSMRDGAQITTITVGAGQAGGVRITAAESMDIAGRLSGESGVGPLVVSDLGSGVYTGSFVAGHGGRIEILTPLLTMNSGHIDALTFGNGSGGDIVINAGKLMLTAGAEISSIALGQAPGGNLTVTATDSISISGQSDQSFSVGSHVFAAGSPSGLVSFTEAQGAGGNITVQTPTLLLQDSATIDAETRGPGKAGDIVLDMAIGNLMGGALITSNTFGAGEGGQVTVRATESLTFSGETPGPVTIGGFTFPHLPSTIESGTFGEGQGGRIMVSAPVLTMHKGNIGVDSFRSGDAGSIVVNVGRLVLTDGAIITAATNASASGEGGSVTVRATDSIFIDGNSTGRFPQGDTFVTNAPSGIFTNTFGAGQGGVISVSTPNLTIGDVQGGGQIGAQSFGPQKAGSIVVEVGSLTLINGGTISGTTLGGDGGNVTVTATDSISISGRHPGSFGVGPLLFTNTQSAVLSVTLGTGKSGRISVSTADLSIHDDGGITAATGGSGAAGDVIVTTGTLSLTRRGQITSSSGVQIGDTLFVGSGAAGSVTVTATGPAVISGQGSGIATNAIGNGLGGAISFQGSTIQLTDGATITATSFGTGNAGNITITAADQFVMRDSTITTQASSSDGGNIEIRTGNLVRLGNSSITTSVGSGAGNGGNISIDPNFVILDHSQIIANAFGGNGGNISITSGVFLVDPSSLVNASSTLGVNGTIDIQSPVQNLSGTLSPLPTSLLKITPLTSACAARAQGGSMSSFTVAGRDGVPAEPGGLLPSPLQQASLASGSGQMAVSADPAFPIPFLISMNWEGRCAE